MAVAQVQPVLVVEATVPEATVVEATVVEDTAVEEATVLEEVMDEDEVEATPPLLMCEQCLRTDFTTPQGLGKHVRTCTGPKKEKVTEKLPCPNCHNLFHPMGLATHTAACRLQPSIPSQVSKIKELRL
jgi:Zn finger protein HypA/HybF involved in hydrogenase expression